MFGFGGKKKQVDPIAAFDGLIEDLERQGAQLRKSAATLLALKSELTRDLGRLDRRRVELRERIETASQKHDARAERIATADLADADSATEANRNALAKAEGDSKLLLEAAAELKDRIAELKEERVSARARLTVDRTVAAALRERYEKFEQIVAVDAARDEVERAHALAELYREDSNR